MAIAVTGCFLRLVLVTTFFDDLGDFIDASFEAESSTGRYRENPFSEARIVECDYDIGDGIRTSTSSLVSEFGLLGLLIDPLILQVPDTVREFSGTYDAGAGHAPLEVTQTDSFAAQTGVDGAAPGAETDGVALLCVKAKAQKPRPPADTKRQTACSRLSRASGWWTRLWG